MEMPLPPMRASALFTEHPAHRSSSGTRPLACGAPDCPRLAHYARRCRGLSARQGWWMGQQHRLSNRLSETAAGRPIARYSSRPRFIQHAALVGAANEPSPALSTHLLTPFRRSCSGRTGDAEAAVLVGSADFVQLLHHNFFRDRYKQAGGL